MIDLCKNDNMIKLNGRTRSKYGCDNKGFTCYKYNGSSVVDYTIVEISAVKQITQFEIRGRRQESDHCPFVFNLRDNFDEIRAHKAPKGAVFHFYKWDTSRRRQYLESVNSPSTMQNYLQFLCDIININSNSDSVLNQFYNLITGAIESNFKKYSDKTRGSFPHNQWFDAECKQLKSHFHSLYKCDPNNTNTAKLCRRYKITTRRKKRQHFRHIAKNYRTSNQRTQVNTGSFGKNKRSVSANHVILALMPSVRISGTILSHRLMEILTKASWKK